MCWDWISAVRMCTKGVADGQSVVMRGLKMKIDFCERHIPCLATESSLHHLHRAESHHSQSPKAVQNNPALSL